MVLDMAQYFLQSFDSLASAFRFLDRFQTQQITLQNVIEKLQSLNVSKAMLEKVTGFFRFLDRGGEGTISWAEFKQLNDLWSEMFLGLEEFLFFLQFKITVEKMAEKRGMLRPPEILGAANLPNPSSGAAPSAFEAQDRDLDLRISRQNRLTKNLLQTMIIGHPPKHKTQMENVRYRYTASNFLDNETFTLDSLPEVWDWLDTDQSGSISQQEFNDTVAKYHYNRQNVTMVYRFIDADGDEIERDEFLFGLRKMMVKARVNAHMTSGKNRKDPNVPKAPVVKGKRGIALGSGPSSAKVGPASSPGSTPASPGDAASSPGQTTGSQGAGSRPASASQSPVKMESSSDDDLEFASDDDGSDLEGIEEDEEGVDNE